MENRRTVLAIFLITIIWLIFNSFSKPSEKPLEASSKDLKTQSLNLEEDVTKKTYTNVNQNYVDYKTSDGLDNRLTKKSIFTFKSSLYEITFSSLGAGILEYKLNNFKVKNTDNSENVRVIDLLEYQGSFIFSGTENFGQIDTISYNLSTTLKSNFIDKPTDFYFITNNNKNLKIIKKYTFYPDSYFFDLVISVLNTNSYEISGSFALNINTPWTKENNSDRYSFIGPVSYVDDKLHEDDPEKLLNNVVNYSSPLWTSFTYKYFAAIVHPFDDASGLLNISYNPKTSSVSNSLVTKNIVLSPDQTINYRYRAYIGPRDYDLLSESNLYFEKVINLGFFGLIAHPLLVALNFFYKYLGNYGFAIVILTICIKAAFWPLTQKSYASMKDMQKLQPQMQKLRSKYGKDKQRLNQEMMSLYKENRVNPFGGCLPMLVQIPVFFALYKVLLDAIELRHAPFLFWITDLSAADTLISDALNLGFALGPLPLIMGFTMFLQQKMAPTNMDPTQAKIMLFMPIFFTFIFLSFPSGLVIYWLVNNILTILQQYLINHKKV